MNETEHTAQTKITMATTTKTATDAATTNTHSHHLHHHTILTLILLSIFRSGTDLISLLNLMLLLRRRSSKSSKKPKAQTFQIRSEWNFADMFSKKIMQRSKESHFSRWHYDVISRKMWCHLVSENEASARHLCRVSASSYYCLFGQFFYSYFRLGQSPQNKSCAFWVCQQLF